MSQSKPISDAAIDEIVTALRRDDLPRAQRAIDTSRDAIPAEALMRLAELNFRRRRWRDAAWLFDQVPDRPAAMDLKRCLSRNLASLEQHRGEIHEALMNLPVREDLFIAPSRTGRPTIVFRRPNGSQIVLSPDNDPLGSMVSSMSQIRPTLRAGHSIAICGMADGYLLHALSHDQTPLFLGMQQPVIVIEPDPHIVLNCLMIHDYTGPLGPIEQRRFTWIVGSGWEAEFEHRVATDPMMGLPALMLGLGIDNWVIQEKLRALSTAVVEKDLEAKSRVERYYQATSTQALAEVFGENPPRKPRVLLLTTLFSTVLQYSTRDSADAFARIGWEARVLIEPTPAHRLYQNAIRRAVDEFKPDLLFQIDHLRYEHGDLFPANLPFACWVQDHLPNLQNSVAGPSVSPRDFVLTDAGPVYADTFNYPRRQLLGLAKLTRGDGECAEAKVLSAEEDHEISTHAPHSDLPQHSALSTQHFRASTPHPDSDAGAGRFLHDLVFVSNASHIPEELVEKKWLGYNGTASGRELVREAGMRLINIYHDGGSVQTWFGLLDFVRDIRLEKLLDVTDAELESLSSWLFHPLNNALYRHQALLWAAGAAGEAGLTLAIYGKGWEQLPLLAPYARGPVEYGSALDELSRRSRFNLQIVPFLCLHQRLLDGLVAGGFYLVRSHPADTACSALLDFLHRHFGDDVRNLAAARSAVPTDSRRQLEQMVQACIPCVATTAKNDPVEIIRSWEEIGLLRHGRQALPRLDEISFSNPEELRLRIERFVAEPETREKVLAEQRRDMLERFTYAAGLKRVVDQMHRLLGESAGSAERAAA